MDITKRTTSYQVENREWVGSQHGIEATETITLDLSLFAADRYPNGYLPSGLALAKMTTQQNGIDVYGPYDPASDIPAGSATNRGHLFNSIHVPAATGLVGAPLFTHGKVRVAKLPFATGKGSIDAAAQAEMPQIRYI